METVKNFMLLENLGNKGTLKDKKDAILVRYF